MKVTEFLAIYAALLSTIVFIWSFVQSRSRINVELVFGTDEIEGKWVGGAYISVKNPSPHTVYLSNISMLFPSGKRNFVELTKFIIKYKRLPTTVGWVHSSLSNYNIDDGCPLALESGNSDNLLVPDTVLDEVFQDNIKREMKVVVQDQLWRSSYSNKFEYPKMQQT